MRHPVHRGVLEKKLQSVGIYGDLLNWLKNYLQDRRQYAVVNGEQSETKQVCFGVPQGSLLGPRILSVLVNDLPDSITKGDLHKHADDTTVYDTGQNVEEVIDDLNIVADNIFD